MATNLLDLLSNEFSGEIVSKIADALGEYKGKTQTALDNTLPAIVGALVRKGSTSQGAADLLDLLKLNGFDGSRFTSASNAVSGVDGISKLIEIGGSLLSGLFGSRTDTLIDWVSSSSGLKKSSTSSLFGLALPIVLGQIGRLVGSSGWSTSSLMGLLSDQRNFLRNIPSGLSNILDSGDYDSDDDRRRAAAMAGGGESRWWKWAIPLLLLLALIPLLGRWLPGKEEQLQTHVAAPAASVKVEASPVSAPAPVKPELGAFIDRKLPNGVVIHIPTNGVESKLIAFIEDPNRQVDKETWFSFDRLEFETDSAVLKPTSAEQLRNIHEILKAYPNVNLKIGGYTDNVGADDYNMKLSQNRATNTMNEIVKHGVEEARLAAEGYGEQYPVGDNATEEGRQRNRRIDVRVTKK
jgi:outer membrane protein OmpA-like peptidoglycan-associated protein